MLSTVFMDKISLDQIHGHTCFLIVCGYFQNIRVGFEKLQGEHRGLEGHGAYLKGLLTDL